MIKRLLAIIIFILLLVLGMMVFIAASPAGLKLAVYVGEKVVPGLHITGAQGSLAENITIKTINYKSDTYSIHAKRIQLSWQAINLLFKKLSIKKLDIKYLVIYLTPTSKEANKKTKAFSLPFSLSMKKTNIHNLAIHKNNQLFADANNIRFNLNLNNKSKQKQTCIAATAGWQELDYRAKQANIVSKQAKMKIIGPISHYQLTLQSQLLFQTNGQRIQRHNFSATTTPASINIDGNGNGYGINLTTVHLQTLQGELAGLIKLQWAPQLTWSTNLHVDNINPAVLWPAYPGKLNFQLLSNRQYTHTTHETNFSINHLQGRLKGQTIRGGVDIKLINNNVIIPNLQLNYGKSNINIHGKLTQAWQINWRVSIPELSDYLVKSRGSIRSYGRIQGTRKSPNLNATIEAQNISYKHIELTRLRAKAKGTLQQHQLTIMLRHRKADLQARLAGGITHHAWQGQIQKLIITSPSYHNWHLRRPTTLSLAKDKINTDNLCLQSNEQPANAQLVCAKINWLKGNAGSIKTKLSNIKLADLAKKIVGTLSADADLSMAASGQINGQAQAKLSPGHINYSMNNRPYQQQFSGGHVTLTMDKKGLRGHGHIILSNKQRLLVDLTLPGYNGMGLPTKNQAIKGSAHVEIKQLHFVSAFIKQLQNVSGQLRLRANVAGTIAKPTVTGSAHLINGQAKIPSLGITLRNASIAAKTTSSRTLDYQGSAESGPGTIKILGKTHFNQSGFPTALTLTGDNLLVSNNQHYKIYASPRLDLQYDNKNLAIIGAVHIPKAKITKEDFQDNTEVLSDDIVYVYQKKKQEQPLKLTGKVKLTLGKDVFIKVRGVRGYVRGALTINYDPSALTTATGELHIVKGVYNAYGQMLKIKTGRLIYTGGPINNPNLDIEAIRKVTSSDLTSASLNSNITQAETFAEPGQVIVGVKVTGSLDKYQVSLFSQPPIYSQSDILSILILGSPTSAISGDKGALLLKAASNLNLGGGQVSHLKKELQSTLGLDVIDIRSESQYSREKSSVIETPSLVVGKRLTQRIFISYSLGLLDPINIFKLRYQLNRNWFMQTESSTLGNGVDIFYSYER